MRNRVLRLGQRRGKRPSGATRASLLLALLTCALVLLPAGHAGADGTAIAVPGPQTSDRMVSDGQLPSFAATASGLGDVNKVSGEATAQIDFRQPAARGGAQPHVALHYNSSASEGEGGLGWKLNVPSIQRSNLSGLPNYQRDPAINTAIQTMTDRFAFDGMPLVPLCTVGVGPNLCPGAENLSQWTGWHCLGSA